MKKIILILIIFLCSGCLDYKEINSLGIISGIAIEKKDNNYETTYEVVNIINRIDIITVKAICAPLPITIE